MYCTNGFDADSLNELKTKYVNFYDHSISGKEVEYLVYHHPSGMEVDFSETQRNDFINEINEMIDGVALDNFNYAKESMHPRDFESNYRQYEKE